MERLKNKKKSSSPRPLPDLPKELFDLETSVGAFMEYWGFKRIHGRIWTHLYTSANSLDSDELMKRLKVSKGLMSLAIRDLLGYNVIQSDHVGRHGAVFYSANPDLFGVITTVLKNRETKMLEASLRFAKNLGRISPDEQKKFGLDSKKIQAIVDLTDTAQGLLKSFLSQDYFADFSPSDPNSTRTNI